MSVKFFIDTNIIVYLFDKSSPAKAKISKEIFKTGLETKKANVSLQVIREFINVNFRITARFESGDLSSFINSGLKPICTVYDDIELYKTALNIKNELCISFYDATIFAAAIRSRSDILYSEDMQDQLKYKNIKIVNPYAS